MIIKNYNCYHTPKHQVEQELCRKNFHYENNQLYKRYKNGEINYKPIGYDDKGKGYKLIKSRKFNAENELIKYNVHVLVWNFHYGIIPDGLCIDHIDRNRANNDIRNLRMVTHKENMNNRKRSFPDWLHIKKQCEHCKKEVVPGMYKRWHGNNCKEVKR